MLMSADSRLYILMCSATDLVSAAGLGLNKSMHCTELLVG